MVETNSKGYFTNGSISVIKYSNDINNIRAVDLKSNLQMKSVQPLAIV
jgi:hypothetical protein